MFGLIKRLFQNEKGAILIEYILLVTLVSLVGVLGLTGLGTSTEKMYQKTTTMFDQTMEENPIEIINLIPFSEGTISEKAYCETAEKEEARESSEEGFCEAKPD